MLLMSTHVSWRYKKNICTFWLKKKQKNNKQTQQHLFLSYDHVTAVVDISHKESELFYLIRQFRIRETIY